MEIAALERTSKLPAAKVGCDFRTRKCSELLKFKDSWSLLPYRPARDFPLPVEIATQEEPLNLPRAEADGDCSQESVKHPMVKVRKICNRSRLLEPE
jgi:hypothetical protein